MAVDSGLIKNKEPESLEVEERRNFQKIIFDSQPKIRKKQYKKRSVRRTCEELVASFYPEIKVSYEAMKMQLISKFDRCNRGTILAYLGRPKTRQKETVDHTVQYAKSGTTINKTHTFIHRLPAKKGYVELFGLASLCSNHKTGKIVFRLFHQRQTELNEKIISPLTNPPHESSALKESDVEFKEALAYAKRQNLRSCPNKNYLSVNSVGVGSIGGSDKNPVLKGNVRVRDGDRERAIKREIKFKVSESNREINNKTAFLSESKLSAEEKLLFSAYDRVIKEGS